MLRADSAAFHVAARAAVIRPLVLAAMVLVVRDPRMTLFAVFAGFALLVLADFGSSTATPRMP
jgi:hypothetical protein